MGLSTHVEATRSNTITADRQGSQAWVLFSVPMTQEKSGITAWFTFRLRCHCVGFRCQWRRSYF
ncbi:hypothetical protein FQN60_015928 [Etheostoma spectabile]|uniref:Uncharacterized protein n=1 Tax=Etheostoma spectabile TaxID=54343 RepID=A0A5J5CN88_9PERO|nr:hypothetical protein FQN60_015928 [Etheostoma spectabile]